MTIPASLQTRHLIYSTILVAIIAISLLYLPLRYVIYHIDEQSQQIKALKHQVDVLEEMACAQSTQIQHIMHKDEPLPLGKVTR